MRNGGRFPSARGGVVLAFLTLAAASSVAQTTRQARFETSSVKINETRAPLRLIIGPGNRVSATRVFLRQIIWTAYGFDRLQVVGGPDWIDTARFDIEAVAPAGITDRPTLLNMLQGLLADRFALKLRNERRTLPVYELTVADAKRVAAGLKPSSVDCAALLAKAPPPAAQARLIDADEMRQPFCGIRFMGGPATPDLVVNYGARTLAQIAFSLRPYVGRVVIDQTELKGVFDAQLSFVEDPLNAPALSTPPQAPSLFRAVEEQLGLKLVSAEAPVEVLVVEHVEMPTEN
jgi:uncharacterized protein (TIGR03435 family)